VGRRKLNFGNPAERQGIRAFGSEVEWGSMDMRRRRDHVSKPSLSATAGHLPLHPSSAHAVDPYSEIDQLSSSARARASLIGVLVAVLLAAVAVGAALLFTAAVFGYPGAVS
jgi:hypothetical protein